MQLLFAGCFFSSINRWPFRLFKLNGGILETALHCGARTPRSDAGQVPHFQVQYACNAHHQICTLAQYATFISRVLFSSSINLQPFGKSLTAPWQQYACTLTYFYTCIFELFYSICCAIQILFAVLTLYMRAEC